MCASILIHNSQLALFVVVFLLFFLLCFCFVFVCVFFLFCFLLFSLKVVGADFFEFFSEIHD